MYWQTTKTLTVFRSIRFFAVACLCCMPLFGEQLFAADADLPAKLPGWVASIESAGNPIVRRVDYALQQQWAIPHQLDDRISTDIKKVQWQGNVEIKASGTYQFHLHVKGIATLTVNNKPIISGRSDKGEWFASESIELPFGSYAATLEVKPIGSSGSIGLYWQGPGYGLEPITDRYLTHATKDTSRDAYERGQLLARALRCSACHDVHYATTVMASPDLAHVAENVRPEWLYQWLTEKPTTESSNASELANDRVHRRMPHFALDQQQALDVIAALWDQSKPLPSMKQTTKNENATSGGDKKEKSSDKSKDKDKGKASERKEPDAALEHCT